VSVAGNVPGTASIPDVAELIGMVEVTVPDFPLITDTVLLSVVAT
jgi:hypothetical protein